MLCKHAASGTGRRGSGDRPRRASAALRLSPTVPRQRGSSVMAAALLVARGPPGRWRRRRSLADGARCPRPRSSRTLARASKHPAGLLPIHAGNRSHRALPTTPPRCERHNQTCAGSAYQDRYHCSAAPDRSGAGRWPGRQQRVFPGPDWTAVHSSIGSERQALLVAASACHQRWEYGDGCKATGGALVFTNAERSPRSRLAAVLACPTTSPSVRRKSAS
jgi:hypothetical protein